MKRKLATSAVVLGLAILWSAAVTAYAAKQRDTAQKIPALEIPDVNCSSSSSGCGE